MKLGVIHHIAVICSDKTAALEFYHEKLGFRIIRENYRPERDDWKIDLEMGDCELELFIMKDHPPSPESGSIWPAPSGVQSGECGSAGCGAGRKGDSL
jgi:glyoxylase I family protein